MAIKTAADIDWNQYDFVDYGCSDGGSLQHCSGRFGKKGIGVDIAPNKVARADKRGFEAFQADVTKLNLEGKVSFISMMNFLEHLPSLELVEQVIATARHSARDFLFIRHPSFEGEEAGNAMGFNQFWWTWDHHPSHIRIADYKAMFERIGFNGYLTRYIDEAKSTAHASVVPASMGRNISKAAAKDKPASDIAITPSWWRRQDIFIPLRAFSSEEWTKLTEPHARDVKYGFQDMT